MMTENSKISLDLEQTNKLISLGIKLDEPNLCIYKFVKTDLGSDEDGLKVIYLDNDYFYITGFSNEYQIGANINESSFYECIEIIPTLCLVDLLKILSEREYKSYGFPLIQLYYNFNNKLWSIAYRNPVDFKNREIQNESPLVVVYETLVDLLENGKI